MTLASRIGGIAAGAADRAATTGYSLAAVARSGLLGPERPDVMARYAREVARHGPVAGTLSGAAVRFGDRPGVVDELGTLTFAELDRRSNALARAWRASGLRAGDGVGIICRNHRGFVDAFYAAAKIGARTVLMNTDFAAPQLADVCEREGVGTLVYDDEFDAIAPAALEHRFCCWGEAEGAEATLEEMIGAQPGDPLDPATERPTIVLLTSGTTGTPKGAPREDSGTLATLGGLLGRVPFRSREATYIGPPLLHALGLAHLILGASLGNTSVLTRRFDPTAMLEAIQRERCSSAIVVPAMLQRTLALGRQEISSFDTSALRIIFCAGSQLPGATATEALDAFGDVLYVLYGSTEVSYVTISTPADHRAAPASVGKPVRGVRLRLLDERAEPVPEGRTGRIFAATGAEFGGYTDGRTKQVIDGFMSTGDVGHLDSEGRLHIDGRDDEMIVSGGENVFPQEVEELLIARPEVADVAVVGVEDEDFGARLAAHVVLAEGARFSADELRSHVRENLARFKVPRDVHFHNELPRTPTGKVLKRELAR